MPRPSTTSLDAAANVVPSRVRVTTLPARTAATLASLRFALPRPALVAAQVLDAAGNVLHSLCEAELEPGEHLCSWDGLDDHGRRFPAGTYTLRLEANGRLLCARVVTLR